MAPVALAATVAAIYLVVHSELDRTHKTTPTSHAHSGATLIIHTGTTKGRHQTPVFYVVRPGDTLSGIALRNHVPLGRLEVLNPHVSPGSLHAGQRLRLRG